MALRAERSHQRRQRQNTRGMKAPMATKMGNMEELEEEL